MAYDFAHSRGDPTGKTGPMPIILAMIESGGEDFWDAAKWPMFFVQPMLDWLIYEPPQKLKGKRALAAFRKRVKSNPSAAWQAELNELRFHYNRWCNPFIPREWADTLLPHLRADLVFADLIEVPE